MKLNKKLIIVVGLILSSSTSLFAQSNPENWYLKASLGYPALFYPSELQNGIDVLKDSESIAEVQVEFELGLYIRSTEKLSYGFSISVAADRYEVEDEWLQFNTVFYGIGAIFQLNEEFNGLHIQTDLGAAKMNFQDSDGINSDSDLGFGFRFGLGYSIPVGNGESRMVPYINYFSSSIESENYSKVGFGLSIIF